MVWRQTKFSYYVKTLAPGYRLYQRIDIFVMRYCPETGGGKKQEKTDKSGRRKIQRFGSQNIENKNKKYGSGYSGESVSDKRRNRKKSGNYA